MNIPKNDYGTGPAVGFTPIGRLRWLLQASMWDPRHVTRYYKFIFWNIHPFLFAIILTGLILLFPIARAGERTIDVLANVHGIPYPPTQDGQLVTQALAHADVYLTEPVFAKKLILEFDFEPGTAETLSASVRENSFWLSYTPVIFFERGSTNDAQHARVEIPLTDKLQDTDRSIDVMFFANQQKESSLLNELADQTDWQVSHVSAHTTRVVPTLTQMKDYTRSILLRERPL